MWIVAALPQWRGRLTGAVGMLLTLSLLAGPLLAGESPAAQERAAKKAEQARRTATRDQFEIRGLSLGLTLAEAEARLQSEISGVHPERKADWQAPAYGTYQETVRLTDGARFSLTFSSPVSGGLGGVVMYEQNLWEGPTPEKLLQDLTTKYGPPDERASSGWWLTWHLRSRASTEDGMGAFLKIHLRAGTDGRVEYFRAVLNDYKFLERDEHLAAEARRDEAQREYERSRSTLIKF
jgi:hypothetical protein